MPRRLLVELADRTLFVKVEDVDWMEAVGNYAKLHVGGQRYLLREPLSVLARELDPAQFVRVHRSAIVQLDPIR